MFTGLGIVVTLGIAMLFNHGEIEMRILVDQLSCQWQCWVATIGQDNR